MSHITAHASKIKMLSTDKDWIKTAINLMVKEFPGIRFEERDGMILMRYAPIEVYQTKGNLRFILSEDKKTFEMHYDYWECGNAVKKVVSAFYEHYQIAGSMSYSKKKGFKAGSPVRTSAGKLQMVATHW